MEQEKIVQLIMQETDNQLLKEIYNNGTAIESYIALTKISDLYYLNDLLNYVGDSTVIVVFMLLKTLNKNFDPSRYKSIFEVKSVIMKKLDSKLILDNIMGINMGINNDAVNNANKELIAKLLYDHFFEKNAKKFYEGYGEVLLKEVKKAIAKNNEELAIKLIFHQNQYDIIKYLPNETFHKILNKSVCEIVEEKERLFSYDLYNIWIILEGVCEELFDDFCDKFMSDKEITEEEHAKILVNLAYSVRMRKIVDFCIEKISDKKSLENLRELSVNWYVRLLAGAKLKEKL